MLPKLPNTVVITESVCERAEPAAAFGCEGLVVYEAAFLHDLGRSFNFSFLKKSPHDDLFT